MELIDILQNNPNPEGLSTAELLVQLGWPDTTFYREKVRAKLRAEIASGRAEYAGDKMAPRLDGRPMKVPVYRVKG